MADLDDLLGSALIESFIDGARSLIPAARQAADWLRRVAYPPPGLTLRSSDGSEYTGFLFIENNHPVLMLAVRVAASSHPIESPYFNPYGCWDDEELGPR